MDLHFVLIEIILPLSIAIVVGWIIKKFFLHFLLKLTHKTAWKSDELVIGIVRKYILWFFLLLGVLYVLPHLGLNKEYLWWCRHSVYAILIFILTVALAQILGGITTIRSSRKDVNIPDSTILSNIVKVVIYCLGFVFILQEFNVQITPLITALGVGGLAVALALQETLNNLFAGIQIISSGKTNIGDFIELENGKKGTITDITWRNTTIETVTNNVVVIPNSTLNRSIVENFAIDNLEITHFIDVSVGYSSNLDFVEKVSVEEANWIALNLEGTVKGFENHVRFMQFADSGIIVRIFFQVQEYKYRQPVASELLRRIHKRYQAEGITIPYPIRTIIQQS